MDAVAQARLGQDLKDMLTELQETIEEEYKKAEARGATEEKNSRPIADIVGDLIVMSPTKRKAYASGRAINKSKYNVKPKGKSPTKASKRGKVVKRRQALIGGGPTQQNTAPRISMERGTGRGAEDFAVEMRELLKVKNAINKIDFKCKSVSIFLLFSNLSAIYKSNANINVVHAITSIFLK